MIDQTAAAEQASLDLDDRISVPAQVDPGPVETMPPPLPAAGTLEVNAELARKVAMPMAVPPAVTCPHCRMPILVDFLQPPVVYSVAKPVTAPTVEPSPAAPTVKAGPAK